ncbi:MAG TPA: substrate-binding domain-containing protein [Bacteroidales bacterium]|nr:substrate-binding domain-containing protein [Bacteroidales bacterium]HQM70787.1 substrate-binding domain-containing protein [Bacteroidales bacterium]
MKKILILLLTVIVIFGCKSRKSGTAENNSDAVPEEIISGEFTISGAFALSPLMKKWAEGFMTLHQDVKITVVETGTGQGIADLIDKKVDLAMISRPLTDDEKDSGIWLMPVAKDGVAIIVNDKNPYLPRLMNQGLSPDEIQQLFTGTETPSWGTLLDTSGNEKPAVFIRADESGASDVLADFCYRKASDLKGAGVTGDMEMISKVAKNTMAIGYCNLSFAFEAPSGKRTEHIQILPFDLDFDNKIGRTEAPFKDLETAHRSVWLGIYPENLCRELTIGSLGTPGNPAVLAFLSYIIGDGQEFVKNMGLCELSSVHLRYARESLQQNP